jgi:hypothetical protein
MPGPFDSFPPELIEQGIARFTNDPTRLTPLAPLEEETLQAMVASLTRFQAS